MNQEIAEIIKFYLSKYDFVNEEFITEIYNLVLKNEDLSEYLTSLSSRQNDVFLDKSCASYSFFNNEIQYNLKKMIYHGKKRSLKLFSSIKSLYLYLFILRFLLHEIEHARQFKKVNHELTPEAFVLSKELDFLCDFKEKWSKDNVRKSLKNNVDFLVRAADYATQKQKLYMFSPSERLADIHAFEQIRDIVKYFDISEIQAVFEHDFYESLLRGYFFGRIIPRTAIPTKFYFDKHKMYEASVWPEIIKRTTDLDELEKMKLGLEVNRDFLEAIKQKSDSIIKSLKK